MPSLLYLSLMRFPTEKAHGLQIIQNCEAFADAGYDVTLWVTNRRNTPDMQAVSDPFEFYGVDAAFRVRRVPVLDLMPLVRGSLERLAFYLLEVTYLIAAFVMLLFRRDDVYYTRDESTALLLSLLKPRHRIAYEAHLFKTGRMGAWIQRKVCQRAGSVIAITPLLARDLVALRGADPHSVLVAHDGIRAARFANLPTRQQSRQALGWPHDAFVVGFVGRLTMLDMDKGVGTLIQALVRVPEAVLCIVGGPDDAAEVYRQQWIKAGLPQDRYWYMGSAPSSDVPQYLCAFDVCAMPHPATRQYASYTSPLKLFEYMASGTAIVASDLPGWADVVRHEHNALLVPPDRPDMLASVINQLKHSPALRQQLGHAAQLQAFAQHTWSARASSILTHIAREH